MELHRLKPMKDNYDPKLFEELYYKTKKLRQRLVSQIDSRRYGVTPDIIESWFDDKFIFAFNRYFDKEPERLLGYIIRSLEFFKYRVLRKAYQENIYSNTIDLDSIYNIVNLIPDPSSITESNQLLDDLVSFLKDHLSQEAYYLFQIELTPPPYIIKRLKNTSNKIPSRLILEYLELEPTLKNINHINTLRKEIAITKKKAKEHFSDITLAYTN